MLKCVELVIALCAFVSGWLAAWYWLKASRVQVDPGLGVEWRTRARNAMCVTGWLDCSLDQSWCRVCAPESHCCHLDCSGGRLHRRARSYDGRWHLMALYPRTS